MLPSFSVFAGDRSGFPTAFGVASRPDEGRPLQVDHLKANMATLSAAKIVYSAGFFITVSPESIEPLGSRNSGWEQLFGGDGSDFL